MKQVLRIWAVILFSSAIVIRFFVQARLLQRGMKSTFRLR